MNPLQRLQFIAIASSVIVVLCICCSKKRNDDISPHIQSDDDMNTNTVVGIDNNSLIGINTVLGIPSTSTFAGINETIVLQPVTTATSPPNILTTTSPPFIATTSPSPPIISFPGSNPDKTVYEPIIKNLLQNNGCNSCHGYDYEKAKEKATSIYDRINRDQSDTKLMPRSGTRIPQEDIDLIKKWIEDGLE